MAGASIERLIQQFSKLPGIGPRSARRIVLQLIRKKEPLMQPLIHALQDTLEAIVTCTVCGNLDTSDPCPLCTDPKRDDAVICVVEELSDLWAIERSHMYNGRYHILGGTLSAIDGRGPDALNIASLITRASTDAVKEIILATNATVDGQTTAHYITEKLSDANVEISQLAQGIPMGGELDYLDEGTLGAALHARHKL
ncbi:MAG: recombination mediator RecR [Rickettsiales bacterium]|nr:recombination mediator RecR [Rickettsiales bacterium]